MKQKEIKTLARYIIDKTDTDAYRAGKLSGRKHLEVKGEMIEAVGGRKNLLEQARFLETNTDVGRSKRLEIEWCQVKSDIKVIHYELGIIPELCKMEKIEDAREHQEKLVSKIEYFREEVKEYKWLCKYYEDVLERLKAGKKVLEAEDELRFCCINEIAKLEKLVWERVFSARVFNDSKFFEKNYRYKMITILKNYSPYYEENMEDYDIKNNDTEDDEKKKEGMEILKMHGILSYAQTLEWKGALQYRLDNEKIIDTIDNIYGTVINTQTLEHCKPFAASRCKKIMTIENKANYESMVYTEDAIYIFCHGYLTPKEAVFLRQLCMIVPENCEFYHWGDMDFGGISIFQYIKEKIFPKLQPYRMDVKDFKEALELGGGIPLKESTRNKLEQKDAGLLEELKKEILKSGMIIEQERLLG